MSGTFSTLIQSAPGSSNTMMLETDGTVLMEGTNVSDSWYRLTPDAGGSYVNGTWAQVASMGLQRLYYGSAVLPDGRVLVQGGEYSGPQGEQNHANSGEIYNPLTNQWASIAPFPRSSFGDDSIEVLPDGDVLAGYIDGPETYIYHPATDTWSPGGTKLRNDPSDEENWVKLPDDSILSYDIFASINTGVGHAQRYIPSTNTWVDAGIVPVALTGTDAGYELGPGVLLADGRVLYFGATRHTAYYTPSTNTWVAGPDLPLGLVLDDAPAAVLPNGKVLLIADTPLYQGPSHLFEFDPNTNHFTDLTTSLPPNYLSGPAFVTRMLVLPTGQILINNGGPRLEIYTPDLAPLAVGVPAITGITENPDGSFLLKGTTLNGISEGAYYGDDAEMATNYPIVRLTDLNNHVFYARTFGWSSTGVATGSTPESTNFTLPIGVPPNTYAVTVVANGVASSPVSLTIPTVGNDPAPTIVTPAVAAPDSGSATSARLLVLGADHAGEANLTYTWAAKSVPGGAIFPSFSDNGTNAAKNDTVTFYQSGAYTLQATITNHAGLSSTSTVTVVVDQLASSVVISPAPADVGRNASQQFSAVALDQFGAELGVQPDFTWSLDSGSGTLSSTGLYTAPGSGTLAVVTAATGSVRGSTSAYVLSAPWQSEDIGLTAMPGAAGDDGNGTFGLASSGTGIEGVVNDSFRFVDQALIGDGLIVAHIVSQQATSASAISAVMIRNDLAGGALTAAMGITGDGSLDFVTRGTADGLASGIAGGPSPPPAWVRLARSGNTFTGFYSYDGVNWFEWSSATIAMGSKVYIGLAVASGSTNLISEASLDHVSIEATPGVAVAAAATPGLITGTMASLSVLGSDNLGEPALSYTWAVTSLPDGAAAPIFAFNGTNAARNDTVTFQAAGDYSFTVTITNLAGLSTTSRVNVSVLQVVASIIVSPPTNHLTNAAGIPFSALAYDQFAQVLANQPAFTWSVAAGGVGGTITPQGFYTRPSPGVGFDTVNAGSGSVLGTANVSLSAGAATQLAVSVEPPSEVSAGVGFALVVVAEDTFGNLVPSFSSVVSLALMPVRRWRCDRGNACGDGDRRRGDVHRCDARHGCNRRTSPGVECGVDRHGDRRDRCAPDRRDSARSGHTAAGQSDCWGRVQPRGEGRRCSGKSRPHIQRRRDGDACERPWQRRAQRSGHRCGQRRSGDVFRFDADRGGQWRHPPRIERGAGAGDHQRRSRERLLRQRS